MKTRSDRVWIWGVVSTFAFGAAHGEVVEFDRPNEVFQAEELRISSGDSRVISKDVELGGGIFISVGNDLGYTGTLHLETGNLKASSIDAYVDGTKGESASYDADIWATGRVEVEQIRLNSYQSSTSSSNSAFQTFDIHAGELLVTEDGVRVDTGVNDSSPIQNAAVHASFQADRVSITGKQEAAVYVDGNATKDVPSEERTSVTIAGSYVELLGRSGLSVNVNADHVAVMARQGGILNVKGNGSGSEILIDVDETAGVSTFGDVALYARDGVLDVDSGEASSLSIKGALVSWRTSSNQYISPELKVSAGAGSNTDIKGDLWAVGGSRLGISTEGETCITVGGNGIEAQNSLIEIQIGSESLSGREYGIFGDIGATYGSESKGASRVSVDLSGAMNVFRGSAVRFGDSPEWNIINLALSEGATWHVKPFVGQNNFATTMRLDGGHVNLLYGEDKYQAVDVGTLSGQGGRIRFGLVLHEALEANDRLDVGTTEPGAHVLHVEVHQGFEPVDMKGYLVSADIDEGVSFTADNNTIEAGLYRYNYRVANRDDEETGERQWYLEFDEAVDPELSPSGEAVAAMAGMGAQSALYLAQLSDLRKRLGEVREGVHDGWWASVGGGKDRISGFASTGFEQKSYRFNFGFDRLCGNWLLGANVKAMTVDQETTGTSERAKGEAHSEGLNLYAAYLAENGAYADFVASFDRYHQEMDARMLNGVAVDGGYHNFGFGLSAEVGRRFLLQDVWFVEPQAQISYYRLEGDTFRMSNGMKIEQDDFDGLTLRAGLAAGKVMRMGNEYLGEYYARVGLKHELMGEGRIQVNDHRFEEELLSTRIYYGLGTEWVLAKNWKVFGHVEREEGSHYTKEFDFTVGVKHEF